MIVQSKQLGFTMIELVITVALLAILATFAIPSYQNMIQNTMIRTTTDSIVTGLQIARAEAVKRNARIQLELGGGNFSAWNICPEPSPAGACVAASIIKSQTVGDGSSNNVTVVPEAGDGGPYVFNSFGLMVSPAGAVEINIDNVALAAADSRNLRVIVAVGGAVKSCDPALNAAGDDPRRCP